MTGPADAGPADASRAGTDPDDTSTVGARPKRHRRWRLAAETVITILMAVLLAGLARTFVFQTFWIPSSSMVPTLAVGDRILVQKAFFSPGDIREGDIVVFSHPPLDRCSAPQDDLVKRIIALPGQSIYSAGNTIYVNGRPLAEPYLPPSDPLGPPIPNATSQHPYRVPPGEFYVMGDNRADSCDSRFWGPITGSSIVGTVILTWWHDHHPEFRGF